MIDREPIAQEKLTHGGDWAGFEMEFGRAPLDFSMNVNPLGIPKEVQEAIAKAGQSAERYPDPLCRELVQKLAVHEEVPPEWIFCGNGAADIIFRLAQALKPEWNASSEESAAEAGVMESGSDASGAGRRGSTRPTLLITAPTFSEYEAAFEEYGWEIRRYLLKEERGFRIGGPDLKGGGPESPDSDDGIAGFLDMIDADVDAVFLCEPNNPTGVSTERRFLEQILEKCGKTGTTLIIDECFNGFLEDPAEHSMKAYLGGERAPAGGLIILKAFTKLYGMAGVRLGYCLCADPEVIGRIRAAGPPWNVSSLAQAAGVAALDAREHAVKGLAIVREERPWLKKQLNEIGIERIFGEANYLLFYRGKGKQTNEFGDEASDDLKERLREHGILIRDCSNYVGLGEGWYRIAVRTHEENEQLVGAIRRVLHR